MAKKKQAKKLKSKKLEDRIAPGMVGGGLVDPGMVDVVEADQPDDNHAQEDLNQTETEHLDSHEAPQGEYLDDASAGEPAGEYQDHGDGPDGEAGEHDDYNDSSDNYDEFSSEDQPTVEYDESGWQEPDWVTAHADGSVDIMPPEGVSIDEGIASFDVEVANEELPLDDGTTINSDGSITTELPEGSQYLEASNQLILPEDSVQMEEIPEGLEAYPNPDGSIMVNLPDDGIQVDPDAGTINFDNHFANEMAPENVDIAEDGTVNIHLPEEGVEYNDDGSVHLSAEASQFMSEPPPEYYMEADYADYNADGSITIEPPEGVNVDGGICEMSCEHANEYLEFPEEFELNADGSAEYSLPESCEYHEDANCITFAEGDMHLDEVPEGIDAHINPDGSCSVMLGEGMEYNGDDHCVELSNDCVNEYTPDIMNVDADGNVQIALPEGTEFYDDGSFCMPAETIDYYEADYPEYVDSCEWADHNYDSGAYDCHPPEGFNLDTDAGTLTCQYDMIEEHIPLDEGIEFHQDGTMDVQMPEGTEYYADVGSSGALHFPQGSMMYDDIPEQVNPELQEDGSIKVYLQDGMEFNPDSGSIHLDNYWTNELTPEPVSYTESGDFCLDLPQDCEYHDDGSFTIPEHCTDFIENPDPSYCTEGPDWINSNPDGSITFEANDNFECHPEEGYIQMDTTYLNEGFADYTPEGVEFHEDGTMTAEVPEGTLYDADAGSLTFPEGAMHMDEIPNEMHAEYNDNGSITVNLPEGCDYDAEAGSVHFDNYWTNEMTPDCVEFSPEGHCHVDMPHDAHFFEDGSVHLPEDCCDFMDEPYPEYVDHGPDWVSDNPDGSVNVLPPEGFEVNAEEGYLSCSYDVAMEQFGGDLIPEEFNLNADGTISMEIPEDIQYDYNTDGNYFTLTETPENFNINEVPDFLEASYDADGNVQINFSEGINYDADSGSINLSNEIVNEMTPEPINFTPEGEFQINLPEDTQYFEEGFVISSDSAEFLDDGHEPHGEYHHEQHHDHAQAS
jgi:hypothetical protein